MNDADCLDAGADRRQPLPEPALLWVLPVLRGGLKSRDPFCVVAGANLVPVTSGKFRWGAGRKCPLWSEIRARAGVSRYWVAHGRDSGRVCRV